MLSILTGTEESCQKRSPTFRTYGRAQEIYDNTAYPSSLIADAQRRGAANAAKAVSTLPSGKAASWQNIGPSGVPASSTVVNKSTAGTSPTIFQRARDRDRSGSELQSVQLHRLHRSSGRRRVENEQCSRVEPELESGEQWDRVERHRFDRVRSE